VSRLEEKEAEMKKEYTKLHERYTEVILASKFFGSAQRTSLLCQTEIKACTTKCILVHAMKGDLVILTSISDTSFFAKKTVAILPTCGCKIFWA
jgi:hypothetical protein